MLRRIVHGCPGGRSNKHKTDTCLARRDDIGTDLEDVTYGALRQLVASARG